MPTRTSGVLRSGGGSYGPFTGSPPTTQAIGHSYWGGRAADGSCIADRIGTAHTRFGIVVTVAAVLGLILTYVFTVHPTGIAAQVPSSAPARVASISPVSSAAPELTAAAIGIRVDPAVPADELPAIRPSPTAPAPSATPAAPTAPSATAADTSASRLVALPSLGIDIWNADERYFGVSGSTPDEIVASAMASVPSDPTGAARSTMAYVGPITWDHRPSYVQDAATGACTMTTVASTVAYQATLPRWTSPSSVEPELLAWWHLVLDHIRAHESQHVRIFDGFVAALPAQVIGQPCGAWDAIIGHWTAEVTAAQSAFDASESHWALPAYTPGG
jgi:predicted secreted Zn-dependent protease